MLLKTIFGIDRDIHFISFFVSLQHKNMENSQITKKMGGNKKKR